MENMNDLIARANKYAKGAGQTQEGHRLAAEKKEEFFQWLNWSSTILSAVVGTSIFADLVKIYPIYLGVAAIVAAGLSAIQRTAKIGEQAESHQMISSEYGNLRRQADMLKLRLTGGDINRKDGLDELDNIGKRLSELSKRSKILPDKIYKAATKEFESSHPEYFPAKSSVLCNAIATDRPT